MVKALTENLPPTATFWKSWIKTFSLGVLGIIFVCACGFAADGPYDLIRKGNDSLKEKAYDKALDNFLKAQVELPNNRQLDYNIGIAHYRLGKFERARDAFEKASLSDDVTLAEKSNYNLGNVQIKLKKLETARDSYKRVLKDNPKNKKAADNLAVVEKMIEAQKKKKDDKKDDKKKDDKEKEKNPLEKAIEALDALIKRQNNLNGNTQQGSKLSLNLDEQDQCQQALQANFREFSAINKGIKQALAAPPTSQATPPKLSAPSLPNTQAQPQTPALNDQQKQQMADIMQRIEKALPSFEEANGAMEEAIASINQAGKANTLVQQASALLHLQNARKNFDDPNQDKKKDGKGKDDKQQGEDKKQQDKKADKDKEGEKQDKQGEKADDKAGKKGKEGKQGQQSKAQNAAMLSPEEAKKLLKQVESKEKQRRKHLFLLAPQKGKRRKPTAKDW